MKRIIISLLVLVFLSFCSSNAAMATVTPTSLPSNTPLPTQTPVPSATFTPVPDLTPEQLADMTQAVTLFEQIGIDPATYTLTTVDGVMVGTDNTTGEEVFRDGKFDLRYAVDAAVATGMLEPTSHKPRPESEVGNVNRPPLDLRDEYMGDVSKEFVTYYNSTPDGIEKPMGPGTTSGITLLLNPETLSWGEVVRMYRDDPNSPEYLLYRQSDMKLVIVPLQQGSFGRVSGYWRE